MKIKRSNLVAYDWKNCLNALYTPLTPKGNGWGEVDGELITIWFEGIQLPSNDEYDEHFKKFFSNTITNEKEPLGDDSNSGDSDTDSEYPTSNEESDLENENSWMRYQILKLSIVFFLFCE